MMRCFIAVDLDLRLREKVLEIQDRLEGLETKLTAPENLHFTLKFLGEVDVNTLDEVKTRIKTLTGGQKPFEIEVENIGAFPNEHFIRVIWAGAKRLNNLQKSVNSALSDISAPEKPASHLTIARVNSQKHRKEIAEFIGAYKNMKIGNMRVDRIKIKKSTLLPKGPVYEDVETVQL